MPILLGCYISSKQRLANILEMPQLMIPKSIRVDYDFMRETGLRVEDLLLCHSIDSDPKRHASNELVDHALLLVTLLDSLAPAMRIFSDSNLLQTALYDLNEDVDADFVHTMAFPGLTATATSSALIELDLLDATPATGYPPGQQENFIDLLRVLFVKENGPWSETTGTRSTGKTFSMVMDDLFRFTSIPSKSVVLYSSFCGQQSPLPFTEPSDDLYALLAMESSYPSKTGSSISA